MGDPHIIPNIKFYQWIWKKIISKFLEKYLYKQEMTLLPIYYGRHILFIIWKFNYITMSHFYIQNFDVSTLYFRLGKYSKPFWISIFLEIVYILGKNNKEIDILKT